MDEPKILDTRDVALGSLYATAAAMSAGRPDAVCLSRFVEAVADTAAQGLATLPEDYRNELLAFCAKQLGDGVVRREWADNPRLN